MPSPVLVACRVSFHREPPRRGREDKPAVGSGSACESFSPRHCSDTIAIGGAVEKDAARQFHQ